MENNLRQSIWMVGVGGGEASNEKTEKIRWWRRQWSWWQKQKKRNRRKGRRRSNSRIGTNTSWGSFRVSYVLQGYWLKFADSWAPCYPRTRVGRGSLSNLHFRQAAEMSFMQSKLFENYWPKICLVPMVRDAVQFNLFIFWAPSLSRATKGNHFFR